MPPDSRRFVAAVVVLAAANGVCYTWRQGQAEPTGAEALLPELPARVGEWTGEDAQVDPAIREYLQADTIIQEVYRSGDRAITATVVLTTGWRGVHSPLGCFPSGGWQIVRQRRLKLPVPGGRSMSHLPVQEITAVKGNHTMVAVFTFMRPGAATDNWVRQSWAMATVARGRRGMLLLLQAPEDSSGRAAEDLAGLSVQLSEPLIEALDAD